MSRRLFTRIDCRIPIQYRAADTIDYREGLLCNGSKTGVYFETAEALVTGVQIQIILPTTTPAPFGTHAYRFYGGRTAWCRSIPGESRRYGCGVALVKGSQRLDGADAQFIRQNCDWCNAPTPCHELCKTSEVFYLCAACHRYLKLLPEGHLKNSIKRFLLGNVL